MRMYQDAYIKQKKQEMQMMDISAFYNGIYVRQAVASCFSKNANYPKQPLSLQPKEKPLSGEEQFKLWVAEHNRRFEEKQGVGVS